MSADPTTAHMLAALDAWAHAGDMPASSAPDRWSDVLVHLVDLAEHRPVGLDAFLVPLA